MLNDHWIMARGYLNTVGKYSESLNRFLASFFESIKDSSISKNWVFQKKIFFEKSAHSDIFQGFINKSTVFIKLFTVI
jgi:hypothetical protein